MLRKGFRKRNKNKKPGPKLCNLGIYCKLKLILLQFDFLKPIGRNFCLEIRRSVAQFLRQLYCGCRLYQTVAYIKGCKNDLPCITMQRYTQIVTGRYARCVYLVFVFTMLIH